MSRSWKSVFVMLAVLWALICGGFTYDVTLQKKRDLYREYVNKSDPAQLGANRKLPLDAQATARRKRNLRIYHRALRELYWAFAPFFWFSITLSGYIFVAGVFLPIRWSHRALKAG